MSPPTGLEIFVGFGFYKYIAPMALEAEQSGIFFSTANYVNYAKGIAAKRRRKLKTEKFISELEFP
jgi:hypothetical protein